jgi:hypothetical protein
MFAPAGEQPRAMQSRKPTLPVFRASRGVRREAPFAVRRSPREDGVQLDRSSRADGTGSHEQSEIIHRSPRRDGVQLDRSFREDGTGRDPSVLPGLQRDVM